MAISKAKMREAALAIANKVRAELNLPPMDHLYLGRPSDGDNCPITNTVIDDDLDVSKFYVRTTGHVYVYRRRDDGHIDWSEPIVKARHAGGSQAFVNHFDNWEFPDLIGGDRRQSGRL